MPARHSVYGGSNASMWLNCPGGVALRTQVPRRPAGMAAEHGTACHEIMEQLLLDPDRTPESYLGVSVFGVLIERHHVLAIAIALAEYQAIEATFGDDVMIYSEREVALSDEAYGTMDAGLVEGKRAAIIDFKFGQEEVVADSDQGKVYAAYARRNLPEFAKAETIELYIIQPALDPATDKLVVTAAEIDTFTTTIETAIRVSKQPQASYIEGSWCKWCDAKLACPAKTQRLDTLTAPNHLLDLQETADRLIKIKSWQKWAEEAEKRLLHEIEHGVKVDGWKLVAKRGVRKWIDEPATIAAFKAAKIPASQYLVTEVVSPKQAEKFLPRKRVGELASLVSSGNTIAPSDDPRPEVMSDVLLDNAVQRV